jgi:hypothetical protein
MPGRPFAQAAAIRIIIGEAGGYLTGQLAPPAAEKDKRKYFFFEKKKQKTFGY